MATISSEAFTETIRTLPLTCHGHSRPITHLQFSNVAEDGKMYLISACKDISPMLRDGMTGDWIGTFIGHKGAVWQSRISQDGNLAATASADFTACVWDALTGRQIHSFQHNHIVRAVAFPPQATPVALATGGAERKLRIFDLNEGHRINGKIAEFEIGTDQHPDTIRSVVWTTDPNVLITGCEDKNLRWWDLRIPEKAIATYLLDGPLRSCEMNSLGVGRGSNPSTLSVAAGKSAYFFEGKRPNQLIKQVVTDYDIASVALNGKSGIFVTGSASASDTWVRVWDFDTGLEKEIGKGHHGPIWACSFSPDGKLYATGSEDGTIKLWKSTTGAYGLWEMK